MEKQILRDLLDKIQSMSPADHVFQYHRIMDLAEAAVKGFELAQSRAALMTIDAIERLNYLERRDAALLTERAAKENV